MITPASIADWLLLAGTLGLVTAFATVAHRWTLREETHEPSLESIPYVTTTTPRMVAGWTSQRNT